MANVTSMPASKARAPTVFVMMLSKTGTLEATQTTAFGTGDVYQTGGTLQLVMGNSIHGKFTSVTVNGRMVTPIYTSTGVQLRMDAGSFFLQFRRRVDTVSVGRTG
ncbi:hypothetical protein [Rhodoferax saidenbachensis]|uniref:Uncharacterized protein n=1 Tax=Rhodoferax saidenbachensis TaxID=1484693 RepID=A0ABU1ZIZ8_9BURK|nr:hypothetical protein [Rhodoferax saidenbachensis]MDR7305524.1 hypothetical protein [Rhodoferax saidenbachensis]